MKKNNEIVIFDNQEVKLEVSMMEETVWLTANQMSKLFDKDVNTINDHIRNTFTEGELNENTSTGFSGKSTGGRKPKIYNLDVIISVGYRVHSHNGVIFRKWATKVLKDYMIKGYAINQQRLEYLEKTVKLLDIANRGYDNIRAEDSKEILRVINEYTKALDLLDDYDHRTLSRPKGTVCDSLITYDECMKIISKLKFNEKSNLFALERDKGLQSIINDLYISFDGKDVYPTIEEKGANFLYMVVKNHTFIDGNKRIAATLFIYFLQYYNILYRDGKQIIDNNTLTALTLLIAESNPKEKEIIIDLILNFLNVEN